MIGLSKTLVSLCAVTVLVSACGGGGGGSTPAAVSASASTVVSSPTSVLADGVAASTLTATLLDADGNPIAGKDVTISSSRGTSDAISAASGPSDASGVVTFTVRSSTTGSSTYTAVDATDLVTLADTARVDFVAGDIDPARSTVRSSPAAVAADGSTASAVTVALRDANDNPAPGKAVTLSSTRGAADSISPSSASSDASGVVVFSVRSSTAGSSTYTAVAGAELVTITQTAVVDFLVGAVSPGRSTVASSPGSVIADGVTTSTLTVTLVDASGNPLSGREVAVSSSRGDTDTISSASGPSDVSGVVTFTVTSSTSGTSTYSAVDATDLVTLAETAQVEFVAGDIDPARSTVRSSPAAVAADGSTASTVTVTLRDANDNPAPGKVVTLSSTRGAADSISPSSESSDASGVAVFSVTSSTAGSSTYTALAGAGPVTIAETAVVDFLVGAVSPGRSTVASSPGFVVADGATSSTLTVTLVDASGNPIPGKEVAVSSSRGATDAISTASGPSDASGVVTFTVTSSTSGTSTYSAADVTDLVDVIDTAQVAFVAGNVDANRSSIASHPTSVVADGSSASTVTVTLRDSNDNRVSGKVVTLSSTRGVTDSISPASATSDASGVATFSVASTAAGTSTCSAIDETDLVPIAGTARVTFVPGAVSADQSSVTSSPAAVVADGSTPSTITVTLRDMTGNPVAGKTVTLSSSRGAIDSISTASGPSDPSGVVTFLVSSATWGEPAFTASVASDLVSVTQTAPVVFRGYRLAFTTQPAASSVSLTPFSPQPVIAAQDAAGNTDTTLAPSVTVAMGSNPGGGTLAGTLTAQAANGVASFSDLSIDKAGAGYTLVASADGFVSAGSNGFEIVPGGPSRLAFVIQPSNTGAGIGPSFQVALQDASGNQTTSTGSTVTVALGTNPGGATLTGTTAATSVDGVATFTGLGVSAYGAGYTLVATDEADGLTPATSASFDTTAPLFVGSGTAASCTEAALNAALAAGGNIRFECGPSPVTITFTSQKTISVNTSLDGGGLVTLSGAGALTLFAVNAGRTLALSNLVITGGATGGNGGAIYNGGALSITNATVSGNSASRGDDYYGTSANGGAIFNVGSIVVTGSTFSTNSASSSWGLYGTSANGGAIFNAGGRILVANSTFSGNSVGASWDVYGTGGNGGAIFNSGGTLWVTSSTFSANSASASYNYYGVGGRGGALFGEGRLTNTIIAGSPSGGNCSGTFVDGGHDLDSDGSCGVGAATNPRLDPTGLADNGGPTRTIGLQAGSPAIDAGDEAACAAAPVNGIDQRGFARPGTGAASCSVGAFEYDSAGPP